MVTFRLVEENEHYIIYWYFPEGKEDNGHGIIVIDKQTNEVSIAELAPDDFSREVSVEEQNALLDSVNKSRIEEDMEKIPEDERPHATKPFIRTFFADHVISKIMNSYRKGIILKDGMSAWY